MRLDPTLTIDGDWSDIHAFARAPSVQHDDFEFRSLILEPDAEDDEWAAPSERYPRFRR